MLTLDKPADRLNDLDLSRNIDMEVTIIPLEIHIHLEDGRIVKFAQQNAGTSRALLNDIRPGKLFSDPVLLPAGGFPPGGPMAMMHLYDCKP